VRLSGEEESLLASAARPIVLLMPLDGSLWTETNTGSRFLGAFLPNTGLHQMLTDALGPLIMTSANLSGDAILFSDDEIFRAKNLAVDGILYHTREILTPLDDSVVKVHGRPHPDHPQKPWICAAPHISRKSRRRVDSRIRRRPEECLLPL
jgi:hydrogenase maturation protein HypF